MALVLADRVQQTGTANTTVSFTLSGSVTGFQSFAVVGNGNTTYYSATDNTGNWEVGIGTYSTTGPTLTRTTILSSSNSGSAVTFSGSVTVFVTYPSEVAVTTDTLAYPPAIGGTTAAAGTFTTLIGGSGFANYEQITGGATGNAVQFQSLGSDGNVSLAIQPKGTGAIDLAAGSKGVNISNGGTVTAITRTASGSGSYTTTPPSMTVSAPTTAGGVQATVSCTLAAFTVTVVSGGSGYAVGDTLNLSGGTNTTPVLLTVATLSGSAIATATITNGGSYTSVPTGTISTSTVTGSGSGATFTATWGVANFSITNAGSGYVEQPTITFSSGTAAAYATVGGTPKIQTLGTNLDFYTPGGQAFRVSDGSATATPVSWVEVRTNGTTANIGTGGTSNPFLINTNSNIFSVRSGAMGSVSLEQFRVSNVASAVNYVNVTGAATGSATGLSVSAQGSDGNINLNVNPKGTAAVQFDSIKANYIQIKGAATSSAPSIAIVGTDTDIQLSLVPKGLGIVLMNQQTPTAVTATGTLTIANLLTQIITSTSATAVALTLPTGTLSDAGVSGGTSAVNTSFDWSIINLGSAVGDVTLVAGTGHTIVGSAIVTVGTSGKFRSRKTATNTFVSYRV